MERPYRGRGFAFLFATAGCLALVACGHHGGGVLPQTGRLSAAQTYSSGSTSLTITPNYHAGFGPVRFGGSFTYMPGPNGPQDPPRPGPQAVANAGVIDFGDVEPNMDYLYEYAAQIKVTAPRSFQLYGEATSDLNGVQTLPVSTHLYWLPTAFTKTAAGQVDANMTFASPSTPFSVNAAPGNGANPPIYRSSSGSATLSYDYILRTGTNDQAGQYNVNVAYTVVAQ